MPSRRAVPAAPAQSGRMSAAVYGRPAGVSTNRAGGEAGDAGEKAGGGGQGPAPPLGTHPVSLADAEPRSAIPGCAVLRVAAQAPVRARLLARAARLLARANRDWGRLAAGPFEAIWILLGGFGVRELLRRMGRDPGSGEARSSDRNRRADAAAPASHVRSTRGPEALVRAPTPPTTRCHHRGRAASGARDGGQNALDTPEAHSYTAALIVPGPIPISPSVRGASIA